MIDIFWHTQPRRYQVAIRSEDKALRYQQLIEEQQQSGEAIGKFCESRGIRVSNFRYWHTKLLAKAEQTGTDTPRFIPVTVSKYTGAEGALQAGLLHAKGVAVPAAAMQKLLQATLEFAQAVLS